MKCFTMDLLNESVGNGFISELLETKTSIYPVVRYANPSLIYISEPVIKSINSTTGFIDNVNIISTQNKRILLIPETESENALILLKNNSVADIFTGKKEISDCPHQDHLVWSSDCPLCGAPCLDRKRTPQILEKMTIANIDSYSSIDDYPRYVHFKKGKIEKHLTFKEGVEENGVTLFDVKEEKYYRKGSYIGTGWFSAIIKMKPNSSFYFKEEKYSNTMCGIVWDGDKCFVVN